MKQIIILLVLLQGVLMASSINEVKIKDSTVPIVYEGGDYVPIVSIQFVFTGAGHLSNTKDGIADMSAKLLNEGTRKDGSVGFATKLDARAVDIHSSVGRESFVIEVSALKSEFAYAIERLKELLKDPNYTQEAYEQIGRQKIGWLNQKRSDFDYISATALRAELFNGTPLARPYDGTFESIESITLHDLQTFIQTHIGYNNSCAVVGGDITLDEAKLYTQEVLSLLPKVDTKEIKPLQASDKRTTVYSNEETQQAYIYFGAPFYYSYKEKDQYKAKIAEYLLGGGGFGTRMMEEIRVKRGLTYGVYASLRRTKSVSYMSGYLQTKLSTQDEAIKLIQEVVDTFVAKGITEDELDKAKKFLVGSEPLRTETLSQRLSRAYNEFYYDRPLGFSKEQLKKLEAVTLEEINEFITSHKELSNITFSVVTKKEETKK
ncbi:pitrilysin family protein [Sulfurovum sp. zt1-1]|uniref:Pitrilysin family protein n=1 Tax=Sulfurovum zhangzhouensis TaxID=3019067 RepID=A0ABT7QWM6_9BACT|nr:pitrilysin family protein [Sulfurovum zhangzhouensis]MDM5271241.1 pitrilysin family protein [Sulfurovum zhangzhouensis]